MTTALSPHARRRPRGERLPGRRARSGSLERSATGGRQVERVVAVIPAHNEAGTIAQTVESLLGQDPRPDRVLVVCDNCTDATAERARAAGAEVMTTTDNIHRKAGALNQALAGVEATYVLVVDADTALDPRFLATALATLERRTRVGAVGGIFRAQRPRNVIERFQDNEYARYALELERTKRLMVLSGTAAVIRMAALREVAAARGTRLPGQRGDVYDHASLTEDNELTLALKSLGWQLVSPQQCVVVTEVMPTLADLRRQRLRWYRGAIDNLRAYGWTPVTRRYWLQQAGLLLGTTAMALYLLVITADLILGLMALNWFWLAIGGVFWLERVITAPRAGRGLAALFVPELLYEVWLQLVFLTALTHVVRGKDTGWHHLNEGASSCTTALAQA